MKGTEHVSWVYSMVGSLSFHKNSYLLPSPVLDVKKGLESPSLGRL